MTILQTAQEKLETVETTEEKLRILLDGMREAISQEGSPELKQFWEMRKLCLPYFQEGVHPAIRSTLWGEYRDLTAEARKLKELVDSDSAFSAEQLELAITSLEAELGAGDYKHLRLDLPHQSRILKDRLKVYSELQGELVVLNAQAGRINGLRKELIATGMRLGEKSKLFNRLSAAGDKVFPRRKELIGKVGKELLRDVDLLLGQQMDGRALRDEIRAFQAFAKVVSLNSGDFNKVRTKLSGQWEKLSEADGDRRKEMAEQRETFEANLAPLLERVDEVAAKFAAGELTGEAATAEFVAISKEEVELGGHERRKLESKISQARKPIQDQRRQEIEALALKSREVRDAFGAQIAALGSGGDPEKMESGHQTLVEEVATAEMQSGDRKAVEQDLKALVEQASKQRDQAVIAACEKGDQSQLDQLQAVVDRKRNEREFTRARVEECRLKVGGSGLDFGAAMEASEALEREKSLLSELDGHLGQLLSLYTGLAEKK